MYRFHNQKGFTLIELLIYVALFAVVSTLLIGTLSVVTRVGGTESVAAEVASQANFVLQTIQRHVAESSLVEEAGDGKKLLVYKKDYNDSVVKIEYLQNDKQVVIKEGPGQAVPLTTDEVSVDNVSFSVKRNIGASDTVQVDLTLSYVSDNPDRQLSRSFSLGIARVNAATFDTPVMPSGSLAIGSAASPWLNGYFTNVVVGPSGGNSLTVTGNASVSGQLGVGASSVTSGTLLEVGGGGYFQFDKTLASLPPPSADCDSANEIGRLMLDVNNLRLYVCAFKSGVSAWKYAPLQ